ncbi:MAG: ABC transporter, partial [Eubacteriales bacterium]|nr:ABC transporter [Eubacteriales bacterium]
IGRALMGDPELLILDEPCTGLDIFSKEQLLANIENISKKENSPTLIYVTHRTEEILPVFEKTLLLRRGEVHSFGNTSEMFTENNLSDFFETKVISKKINNRYSLEIPSLF